MPIVLKLLKRSNVQEEQRWGSTELDQTIRRLIIVYSYNLVCNGEAVLLLYKFCIVGIIY